jgi:hypothetical protein
MPVLHAQTERQASAARMNSEKAGFDFESGLSVGRNILLLAYFTGRGEKFWPTGVTF